MTVLDFFISPAFAEQSSLEGGGLMGLVFPLALIAIFYFFLIRPQMKRQKEHKNLINSLQKGDEIQMAGGIMGKITGIDEEIIKIEIAEGIVIKARRGSVEAVMPKGTLRGT